MYQRFVPSNLVAIAPPNSTADDTIEGVVSGDGPPKNRDGIHPGASVLSLIQAK
jgi:hypothetical protein